MTETSAGWKDNPLGWAREEARVGRRRLQATVGGRARAKVIVLLACILGLDAADKGATGALAAQLEAAFHIGNVELGLLIGMSSLAGAVATLPMGVLADRARRVRVLAVVVVVVWAVAEGASAAVTSYGELLAVRVFLGLVTAAAGPFTASLVGDLFTPGERGRIYGFVLTGELLGAGVGIVLSGDVAAVLGWRGGYAILALPSLVLAWYLWHSLPEPARGGQSYLRPGDAAVVAVEEVEAHPEEHPPPAVETERPGDPEAGDAVLQQVHEEGIRPDPRTVITGDPTRMRMLDAVRWVLRVRTNVALIVASALGYFFLGGVRAFSVIFVRGWYGVGQAGASSLIIVIGAGAVVGVLVVSRLADTWVRRGRFDARMLAGAGGYILAAALFLPALFTHSLAIALIVIVGAAFFLGGANPPVDAARLDVIPSRMWGRAEAIRTFLRQILEAFAPIVFGYVATLLGGSGVRGGFGAGVNGSHTRVSPAEAQGLGHAFLVMLLPLAASGVMLLLARRRYGIDVASAGESEKHSARAELRRRHVDERQMEGAAAPSGGPDGAGGAPGPGPPRH